MLKSLQVEHFNCLTDYAIENINRDIVAKIQPFFNRLPVDPYLAGNYRWRRFSAVKIVADEIIHLPNARLFQSHEYNPILGDVTREYLELEKELLNLAEFQKVVAEFWAFCQLCSTAREIGIHQIRTKTSEDELGQPAPEGIHRDGVDLVAIFCANRINIQGGATHLYKSPKDKPIFQKILNPGELLVFNDREFLHFTTPIEPIINQVGYRDVFVFTCPGLLG